MSQQNVEIVLAIYWLRGGMALDRFDPNIAIIESKTIPGFCRTSVQNSRRIEAQPGLSSDNSDMECPTGADEVPDVSSLSGNPGDPGAQTPEIGAEPLRCVWSGPANGCSCGSSIPGSVVTAAWRRELEDGERADRFFEFAWEDDVWLAYGLKDGGVRGVHCPPHRAERAERASVDEHVDEFALYA
jgi:hypothetical protein